MSPARKAKPEVPATSIRMVKVADLRPDPDNPRVNSGAVAYVVESIRQFGFKVPIVVGTDNLIRAGHTRYRAAVQLGLTEVPCIDASDLTEDQQKAFAIAENRTSDFAFFDLPKLGEVVQDIPLDLLAGFDIDALIIPQDEEDKTDGKSGTPEKRPGLDLAPFERYQYVMILCRTEFDYTNLLTRLGLENTQKRYVDGALKQGASYGRVIEYADFLDKVDPQ
ncbi:ParB-like nuclease domain protein [Microbacterium phage NoodlelyBoi]|uniref:ParB-like nuclease domain protein n=1 Tax=Microbacterium phage NoodlelyBoi TaxID=2813165 RepID=A0A899IS07_9CAUD|nr:ParB-like nuclease domain protein [Microbacterium phage NoodlelyBoi]QSM01277.1 ParB-like nuclease domain protein [Microbacterium phage NoodlelyBoi]